VGVEGTILRLDPPDLAALNAAVDLSGVKAALSALGIPDKTIGAPLEILNRYETNRQDRRDQLKRDEAELLNKKASLPSLVSIKTDPLEIFTFIARFGFAIVLFFLVNILASVYRYSLRLAAHYDARADALDLSNALLDRNFRQLVQSLTPSGVDFGKLDRSPTEQMFDAMRSFLQRRGGSG
jgi:hypothetical protein